MASSGWNSYGNVAVVEIAFSRGTNRSSYGLISATSGRIFKMNLNLHKDEREGGKMR